MRIEKVVDETQLIINSIIFLFSSIISKTFLKQCHSTLSYALLISNLRDINFFLPFPFLLKKWSISQAIRILSKICHMGTKAFWVSKIRLGREIFNLVAITFATILYRTLQRLIGWKSTTFIICSFLGTKVMKVCLKKVGQHPEFKILIISLVTCSPTMCQYFW